MKIAKKTLSIFLSLLMIFSACSVALTGMTITAAAATGTVQSVQNALTDYVVNEIVYHGHLEHNSYTYKGDAAVAAAADEIYAYAMSLREGNATTSLRNSTAGMLAAVAANTGFTSGDKYRALQYILDPPGDVITSRDNAAGVYGGECDGCEHKSVYPAIPTNTSKKTVKVYGTVNSLLEKYSSVNDIPASLLQGVQFEYSMMTAEYCIDTQETVREETGTDCDGNPTYEDVTYNRCYGYRWNYFSTLKRTEIKNIVSIDELKEFGETLASADLSMTFDEMIALPAAELQAIYDENYAPYQAMIDKYSFDVIKDLYGSYNDYFADLLKAMQINLSLPAIDILMDKVGTAYDSTNYDEMAAIYAPTNSAYNAIKGYGSEVFDYISTKAEYADFDLAAAKAYLDDMKKAMDLITLPGLKATIDADLAAYDGVNLNTLDIPVLKTLLNKLNGYKGTINAANGLAVSSVMASTVNKLDTLIANVKAILDAKAPAETEEAFNVQYNYYTPLLFGNYSAISTADLMTMYSDYQTNLDALKVAYDEQVAKYGASVVNPLFSVTIGEGGTPTLIQNVVSSVGTTGIQADLTARNSAQLAIAAGYKDMAANVSFDNLVIIGSAIKDFDQSLYQLCADNGWVSTADQALYADVQAVINAFNAFVNKINTSGFQKVEQDENGVYVVRDVYDTDLVKEEAYEVTEEKLNDTIVKLDNFIASEDFGALLGFEDADGNAVGLGDYLYGMLGELLFNNDLINMVVGMLFPMIEDLLVNEVGALLSGETVNPNGIEPQNPGAVGYVDLASLVDAISGGIDVYIGDTTKEGQQKIQQNFPTLLAGAGLYVYPTTLADSLVTSGVLTTSDETYKLLKEAGNSWTPLGVFDPETETFTYDLNLDWGITDSDSFTKVLGGVLDAVGSLLPTLFLNTAFNKTLGSADSPAGVGFGSISAAGIVNVENSEFYATLSLAVQPLNLYSNLFQPLFGALGLTANANLSTSSKGIDYAKAVLDPIFALLDKVVAAPLDTILGILPSLAYILSTDFIDSFLGSIVLDFSVKLGIAGSNAGGLWGTLLNLLGDALSFEVFGDQMGIADIAGAATLKELVGIDISNINTLLDFLFETLEVELDLPDIDQTGLIECAKWNSANNLTADKADVLFFLLDYLVSALNPEFLNAIIGLIGGEDAEEPDEMLTTILNEVVGNISNNPDDVIAALVELLNPVKYSLKDMTWAEGSDESVVYLHYANDWTKSESQYIIDNVDSIVKTVLGMADSDIESINALLGETINGLFTNETVTSLVETLTGLGEGMATDDILYDILANQLGVDITAWYHDFAYLFDYEGAVAPETSKLGVTAVADEEGNLVWNGMADGDSAAFADVLCAVLAPLAPAVAFLLGGENLSVFGGVVTLYGYESFASTLGTLMETLGVAVPAVDFSADPMGSLNSVVKALLGWLNDLIASDNMIAQVLEVVPDLIRYIESNGLSVLLYNLLMPVLALVDTVRPLVDVDVNTILSVIVSDLINGNELDTDKILGLVLGTYEGNDDITVTISIDKLTLIDILKIADGMLGSNLVGSPFATIGLKGLCNADVDAADALTIILSALIDSLDEPAADASMTNAQAIFGYVEEQTGNDQITEIVTAVLDLIEGIVYEYDQPNWGYMFGLDEEFNTVLPEHSIVYLGYTTDWTEETAATVYDSLDEIVDMILESALEEGETIATLLNGILEDNVYSDEILNTVVELLVNLLADLDASLFEIVDVVVDTNIATWFTFCTFNEETGEYECTKDWGVDEATDKKATFVAAIKEVLAPANQLLAWLFFGDSYEFFTDSEVDADGNYTYKSLITLNGGEGYAKGLVPILEALGCEMKAPAEYLVDGKYDVPQAVEDIFNALLALVDKVSAAPVEEVFKLLPNLIYFINADGIKSSVNNLLAPVNAIIAKLAPIVGDVSIGGLLAEEIGLDITDISMDSLLGLAADAGFTLSDDMVQILKTFYIGELEQYTSANGDYAYRMVYNDEESAYDMLTIVLAFALDAFKLNGKLFADLLGEDTYNAIVNLLAGATSDFEYADPNWAYMYDGDVDNLIANNLPARTEANTIVYTQYTNNWNKATASYLNDNLSTIVETLISALSDDGSTIGVMLEAAITDGLYKDEVLNSLLETVVELLAGLDSAIVNAAGAALGADLSVWFDYCDITYDADGNVTDVVCTKDWGINSAEDKATAFVNAFVEALAPANRVLAWLFFGEDYTFFNGTTSEELITISGGDGYAFALVPLLEALGCSMKPAYEYYNDGELDMSAAVRDVFTALCDRITDVCSDDAVDVVLELLPNLIYFINADGAKVVVNNLLQPAYFLLETLSPLVGDINIDELIGFPISDIDFNAVFDLLADELGIYFPEKIQNFITTFYLGEVEQFTSANGKVAFRMVYSETETRREMLTILLSLVIDVFNYGENKDAFSELLGEDAYNAIKGVLDITEAKAMQEFSWLYTEYADTDKTFTPIETTEMYTATYNEYWTKDKAQYLVDNAGAFIQNVLHVLNLEINGVKADSVEAIINSLISDLYSQANADAILAMLKDLVAQLADLEPYGELLNGVIKNALGVDLTAWDNMVVTVEDGNRESFSAALGQILAPVVPVLELLLTGKDVRLFYNIDGEDSIVIPGSEGYAYGIIPLLEALGCDTVLTPAEYKAAVEADPAAAITNIIDPLFDRIDEIAADPINEVLELLPAVIYFINSNGLDTVVKNVLNSVDTVLAALEPLIGVTSIVDLLGIDLSTYDFEYLFNMLIDMAAESTGFELEAIAGNAINELTMGRVVSYQSKNGETYYTMQYASDRDMADMVTVLLRLIVDFVTMDENIKAIEGMLEGAIADEETFKSVCSILESVAAAAKEDPNLGKGMAVVYYLFVALDDAAEGADDIYHDVTNSWEFILRMLETSEEPVINEFGKTLKKSLNKYFGTDYEIPEDDKVEEEKPLTGFALFLEKIRQMFKKIGDFFRSLFGMA